MTTFQLTEKATSQIPAVQLLMAMGYEYLKLYRLAQSPSQRLSRYRAERQQIDPSFVARAIRVAVLALSSSDQNFISRAIQVASVVGTESELKRLVSFTSYEDPVVATHARAGVFYLKKRLRNGTTA